MPDQTPTIVLVHGAWADASGWNAVILRLQDDGFTVYAPPNPLRGLPQDAAYLHEFLTKNPALAGQPVVLAAHSYGGAVITNAAVGDPRVNALVYVDAFIPDLGETMGSWPVPSPDRACWETRLRFSTRCPTPAPRPATWISTSSRPWFPAALPPG
jgi:pimeloyl-ACP methyl ester carboxylesterase